MILCDTNVLVALVDGDDGLSKTARDQLTRLSRKKLFVTEPVLTETIHLLPSPEHRARLEKYILKTPILPFQETDPERTLIQVFAWLNQYSEHLPDWADAHLAVVCGNDRLRIWTYDQEFKSIWRRLDGSRISLVGL